MRFLVFGSFSMYVKMVSELKSGLLILIEIICKIFFCDSC